MHASLNLTLTLTLSQLTLTLTLTLYGTSVLQIPHSSGSEPLMKQTLRISTWTPITSWFKSGTATIPHSMVKGSLPACLPACLPAYLPAYRPRLLQLQHQANLIIKIRMVA